VGLVEAERGASVVQHDAGRRVEDAGAEALEDALDEGDGGAVVADRGDRDGVARGPRSYRRRVRTVAGQQAAEVDWAGARIAEQRVACQLCPPRSREQVRGPEDAQQRRPLYGWRGGVPARTVHSGAQRSANLGLVSREVLDGQCAAERPQPGHEAMGEVSLVEGAPVGGDRGERIGQRGLDEVRWRRVKQGAQARIGLDHLPPGGDGPPQARTHLDAVTREGDGRGQ
jgi:hypothetical protein